MQMNKIIKWNDKFSNMQEKNLINEPFICRLLRWRIIISHVNFLIMMRAYFTDSITAQNIPINSELYNPFQEVDCTFLPLLIVIAATKNNSVFTAHQLQLQYVFGTSWNKVAIDHVAECWSFKQECNSSKPSRLCISWQVALNYWFELTEYNISIINFYFPINWTPISSE